MYQRSKLRILEPTSFYESIKVSNIATHGFNCFASFPPEIRLSIWRAAISLDFSNNPISVKPYSHACRERRVPPKTLSINRESRHETLKFFRRMELRAAEMSDSVRPGHTQRWLRTYPIQVVLWDDTTDVLTLDWWCMVEDVKDMFEYLNFQPFVDPVKGDISCVQILDIDTKIWHSWDLGMHTPPGQTLEPHVIGFIEQKLSYFVRLKELRLSMWSTRRTYDEERYFTGVFEACFKRLAQRKPGYCIPMISLVLNPGPRRLTR